MKGVIIAAGDGGRLRSLTLGTPKVLMEIGGQPLIQYALNALGEAGIADIAVVVGYQAERVQEALEERNPSLSFVNNERYLGGNAISVYEARHFVRDEPFVLCMGDHPIGSEIVQKLVSTNHHECVLCIDPEAWHPSQLSDGTRTFVDATGHVMSIGKSLKVWNAIDTGVFKLTGEFFLAVEHLMNSQGADVTISDVVRHMGANGKPFSTCDVGGMFWADVDTPEDYRSIDKLLRGRHGERV